METPVARMASVRSSTAAFPAAQETREIVQLVDAQDSELLTDALQGDRASEKETIWSSSV